MKGFLILILMGFMPGIALAQPPDEFLKLLDEVAEEGKRAATLTGVDEVVALRESARRAQQTRRNAARSLERMVGDLSDIERTSQRLRDLVPNGNLEIRVKRALELAVQRYNGTGVDAQMFVNDPEPTNMSQYMTMKRKAAAFKKLVPRDLLRKLNFGQLEFLDEHSMKALAANYLSSVPDDSPERAKKMMARYGKMMELLASYRAAAPENARVLFEARLYARKYVLTHNQVTDLLDGWKGTKGLVDPLAWVLVEDEPKLHGKISVAEKLVVEPRSKLLQAMDRGDSIARRLAVGANEALEQIPVVKQIWHLRRLGQSRAAAESARVSADAIANQAVRRLAPAAGVLGVAGTAGMLIWQGTDARGNARTSRIQAVPGTVPVE